MAEKTESKKCTGCDGYGLERDPKARDGWKRGPDGNGVTCPKCNGTGERREAA